MKKTIAVVMSIVAYALCCTGTLFAAEPCVPAAAHTLNTPYNWYCKHMHGGEVPPIDSQMKFIEKHGGYYLDKKASDDKKVIYLTFDAGYENGNVEKILDVMKEKEVTGAFFILENLINSNPDLVKRMAAEGHLICNHTSKHKDMTIVAEKADFEAELKNLESVLRDTCGIEMAPYYRPPEGRFSEQNLIWASEMGYKTVFWSFAYVDWDNNKQMPPEKAVAKVMEGTHNGEVILLHPTSETNAKILGELIDKWRGMGYSFGTLDGLCA